MSTATQLQLGADPRAAALISELQEALDDAIAAGVRQADMNLELMRELDQVCEPCRALLAEAIADAQGGA